MGKANNKGSGEFVVFRKADPDRFVTAEGIQAELDNPPTPIFIVIQPDPQDPFNLKKCEVWVEPVVESKAIS